MLQCLSSGCLSFGSMTGLIRPRGLGFPLVPLTCKVSNMEAAETVSEHFTSNHVS